MKLGANIVIQLTYLAIVLGVEAYVLKAFFHSFIEAKERNFERFSDRIELAKSWIEGEIYIPRLAQFYSAIESEIKKTRHNQKGNVRMIQDVLAHCAYLSDDIRELGSILEDYGRIDLCYMSLNKRATGVWISALLLAMSFFALTLRATTGIDTFIRYETLTLIITFIALTSGVIFFVSYRIAINALIKLLDTYRQGPIE